MKKLTQYFLASTFLIYSSLSLCQSLPQNNEVEKEQHNIVFRLYSVTDDALVSCRGIKEPSYQQLKNDVAQLWTTQPTFRQLLLNSPYYKQATIEIPKEREHSIEALNKPNSNHYNLTIVTQESCKFIQSIVTYLLTPEGARDIAQMNQILSQQTKTNP